jgi:C-terminal processing protease CtpA/Prc
MVTEKECNLNIKRIATFCKFWGFLKYYHPSIAAGEINWDSVFINNISLIEKVNSKKGFNLILSDILNSFNYHHVCDSNIERVSNNYDELDNYLWICDTSMFNNFIISKLKELINFKTQFDNYYVQVIPEIGNTKYSNEIEYNDFLPDKNLRLLALSRYWNIINYYFPYKDLMDENWEQVLEYYIPEFIIAYDTLDYHLKVAELSTRINDGHGFVYSSIINKYLGYYSFPYRIDYIDNKTIIKETIFDSLARISDLKICDVILSIDGKPIEEIRCNLKKIIGGSNNNSKEKFINEFIFNSSQDSIKLIINRNNDTIEVIEKKYILYEFYEKIEQEKLAKIKVLQFYNNQIAYVNLGFLYPNDVDSIMKLAVNSKAIIFDIREYPHNTLYKISNYLNPIGVEFVKFVTPDLDYPGTFKIEPGYKVGPEGYNNDYYKGKVFVLINENTKSHGEFTVMALQTAPDVTLIGSPTAGADGNISQVILPGKIYCMFSGIGVIYPDGRITQRKGISPDVYVYPTLNGIKEGRDEVLEKALEILD